MSSQNQNQQQKLSVDALVNSSSKEEVYGEIKNAVNNCLSETNLHLTVPGLKCKTRGKVIAFFLVIIIIEFSVFD